MSFTYIFPPMLRDILAGLDGYDEVRREAIESWLEEAMADPWLGAMVRQYFRDEQPDRFAAQESPVLKRFCAWLAQTSYGMATMSGEDDRCHSKQEGSDDCYEESGSYSQVMPLLDLEQALIIREGRQIPLTPAENSIMKLLCQARGRVVTHRRFEEWAEVDCGGSGPYEPKYHIRHLREKLGDNLRNPKILSSRRGIGYCLSPLVRSIGS